MTSFFFYLATFDILTLLMKNFLERNPRTKKIVGISFIVIGGVGVITPFTPFGFLLLVGLGILGIKLAFWEKIKERFSSKNSPKC